MKKKLEIRKEYWKEKPVIVLENDVLRVKVRPNPGARLVSVYHKGKAFELAAQPSGRSQGTLQGDSPSFADFDPSGMDDAFPNIDPEQVMAAGRKLQYPDHGEVWSHPFSSRQEDEQVSLVFESGVFAYRYQKDIALEGDSLILHYQISNQGRESLPCIWTFHGLLRYEEDMELFFDTSVRGFVNVFENAALGAVGTRYAVEDDRYSFCRVPAPDTCSMTKYYADGPLQVGHCGVYYPSAGVRATLSYDAKTLPYLGVWITAGGFQGDYNCALEPSNGYYDSISCAKKHNSLYELPPGESLTFTIRLRLDAKA
ncbi:MAG: DUF4432 family protein [Lachnospiraceae bacterium]|nr:DUF4432 family protein [Lachnospiraceae bacterium]